MNKEQIREHLISNGVKNLIEFGYQNISKENILTDEVYRLFFKSMLKDNLGHSDIIDEVINELIAEIEKN